MLTRGVRTFLATAAGLALGGSPSSAVGESADSQEPRPPNLLLITVDTLRADHVGVYGYAKAQTQTLDQIATLGVRFERALTPSPQTTPALASLFTGLWPRHHGSRGPGVPFSNGTALAEVLSAEGYESFAVSSTPAAARDQNFDRGFARFYSPAEVVGSYPAATTTNLALALAGRGSSERPQFLWAHYSDPHFPYETPSDFGTGSAEPACLGLMEELRGEGISAERVHENWGRVAERSRTECVDRYDASVHYMDSEIGRLLMGLSELGFLKSVVLVIASVHGEHFGEAGLYYEHGSSLHGAALRIPLLISAAGLPSNHVDGEIFSLEDLMPTLLALLQIPRASWPLMDGHDYAARLSQAAARPSAAPAAPAAFSESGNTSRPAAFALPFDASAVRALCQPGAAAPGCDRFEGVGELLAAVMGAPSGAGALAQSDRVEAARRAISESVERGEARQWAITTKRFKLVQAPRIRGGVQRALFDLESDPNERKDVSLLHPAMLKSLSERLDQWLANPPEKSSGGP